MKFHTSSLFIRANTRNQLFATRTNFALKQSWKSFQLIWVKLVVSPLLTSLGVSTERRHLHLVKNVDFLVRLGIRHVAEVVAAAGEVVAEVGG